MKSLSETLREDYEDILFDPTLVIREEVKETSKLHTTLLIDQNDIVLAQRVIRAEGTFYTFF